MRIYLAGPMFTEAERAFLDTAADRLVAVGHDVFVPHRQTVEPLDAAHVYEVDGAGVRDAEAMVAWLDGPMVDDGTACEIGIFAERCRTRPDRHVGIVGLATDWRTWRRRDAGTLAAGLNLFVTGAIEAHGTVTWSLDGVVDALADLDLRSDGGRR